MAWEVLPSMSPGFDITATRANYEKDNFDWLKYWKMAYTPYSLTWPTMPPPLLWGTGAVNATNGQTQTSTVVPYGFTFPAVPIVVCTMLSGTSGIFLEVIARTTSNFTVEIGKCSLTAFGTTAVYLIGFWAGLYAWEDH